MIASELLRLRYSLAGRVLLAILLAEAIFVGLLLAFLPNLIEALITLNEVIPNATSADQLTDDQLAALTLASPQFQVLIADVLGNAGLGASLPAIAATLLGALTITGEFRRGSITNTVLAQPIRWRLILAKMTALVYVVTATGILLTIVRAIVLGGGRRNPNRSSSNCLTSPSDGRSASSVWFSTHCSVSGSDYSSATRSPRSA